MGVYFAGQKSPLFDSAPTLTFGGIGVHREVLAPQMGVYFADPGFASGCVMAFKPRPPTCDHMGNLAVLGMLCVRGCQESEGGDVSAGWT